MTTHYSQAQKSERLLNWADAASKKIHENCNMRHPVLMFSGYSGSATATALMLAYYRNYGVELGMMYVRKPNEDSHGHSVEENITSRTGDKNKLRWYIFVDDTISSGKTYRYTVHKAARYLNHIGFKLEYPSSLLTGMYNDTRPVEIDDSKVDMDYVLSFPLEDYLTMTGSSNNWGTLE